MRVLAADPGYERLGVAVVERVGGEKEKLLFSECIRTPKDTPFAERLSLLGDALEVLYEEYQPTAFATETLFFQKNQKTAMQVAEVRGMLLYIATRHRIPVFEYSPQAIKLAITGNGKADKHAMLTMIPRLISLPTKKMLDDELDAISIALTALASEK